MKKILTLLCFTTSLFAVNSYADTATASASMTKKATSACKSSNKKCKKQKQQMKSNASSSMSK